MSNLPKKILRIEELSFILPMDFNGDILEAVDELVTYLKTNRVRQADSDETTLSSLLATKNSRLCVKYGMFELVGDRYELLDKTINNEDTEIKNIL